MVPEALALAYLDAVSANELDRLDALVAPDVRFATPATTLTGLHDLVAAFRRISSVHVRSDVRRVFSDGDDVCVIYDFVTDVFGTIPTVEWIRVAAGRIRAVTVYYDREAWLS